MFLSPDEAGEEAPSPADAASATVSFSIDESGSARDRSYSDGHALCSKSSLSWQNPLHSVINSNSADVEYKRGHKNCVNSSSPIPNGNAEAEGSPSSNNMRHHHHHHGRRPRSKSESESQHHPHRRSPVHKKKYHHLHGKSHHGHDFHRISPVPSPKFRSLGKMWIRPVPIRRHDNGPLPSGQNGQNGMSASTAAGDSPSNNIPFLPTFFGSTKQVASSLDQKMSDATLQSLSMSMNPPEARQVSETSSFNPSNPASPPSFHPPLDSTIEKVRAVDGATSVFSAFNIFPPLYASPNSSFDSYHLPNQLRHLPSPYSPINDPALSPSSSRNQQALSITFGESGKPITTIKRSHCYHHPPP